MSKRDSTTGGGGRPVPGAGGVDLARLRPARLATLSCLVVGLVAICLCLVWTRLAGAGDLLDQRRAEIERMDPAEKEQLRKSHESFESLNPAEQKRLRQLHEAIEKDVLPAST